MSFFYALVYPFSSPSQQIHPILARWCEMYQMYTEKGFLVFSSIEFLFKPVFNCCGTVVELNTFHSISLMANAFTFGSSFPTANGQQCHWIVSISISPFLQCLNDLLTLSPSIHSRAVEINCYNWKEEKLNFFFRCHSVGWASRKNGKWKVRSPPLLRSQSTKCNTYSYIIISRK